MRYLLLIIILLSALTFAGYRYTKFYYETPNEEFGHCCDDPKLEYIAIFVEKGSSLTRIAHQLANAELIRNPKLFTYIARFTKQTNAKHGEYSFSVFSSPKEILEKLERGETVVHKFTIPEGKTSYEILQILGKIENIKGELPTSIDEGSVMPDTYLYSYGDTYQSIIKKMKDEMSNFLAREWEKRDKSLPLKSPYEALILASIVEKETGLDGERGKVASVFINRLNRPMRLESDPTAVYGITKGKPLGDKVRAKHVRHDNEYNTYKIDRLPPTPICAPGFEAIEAVLNPPTTDYYYFVASGKGGHNFAKTLSGHNANVVKYREALKRKGQ